MTDDTSIPDSSQPHPTQAELERLVAAAGLTTQEPPNPSSTEPLDQSPKPLLRESYKGIFPHPAVLRQLDDIVPNGAERAFSLTEREQAHRHALDRQLVDSEVDYRRAETSHMQSRTADTRIVIIATIALAAVLMAVAAVLAFYDKSVGASLFVAVGAISTVGGLVYARKSKDDS